MKLIIFLTSLSLFLWYLRNETRRGRGRNPGRVVTIEEPAPAERSAAYTAGSGAGDIIPTLEIMLERASEDVRKAENAVERTEYLNSFGGVVVGEKVAQRQRRELYTAQQKQLAIITRLQKERAKQY